MWLYIPNYMNKGKLGDIKYIPKRYKDIPTDLSKTGLNDVPEG